MHAEMTDMRDRFDTSKFSSTHPLYSTADKRALCKFKSETGDIIPLELCALLSKMYTLLTDADEHERAKGIPKFLRKRRLKVRRLLARSERLASDSVRISDFPL